MARRKSTEFEQKHERRRTLSAGSHVWAYLRHSPGDSQTIDSQRSAVREWAAQNGWFLDREFVDEGVEGSKEQRQQFQEMMSFAKQTPRPVDGIVLWSFSRFARSLDDAQYYRAWLRKLGYVIISKTDDVPDNETAPIFESMIDWRNQRFLEDLSVDVKRGHAYIVGQGYWPNGSVPIGYRFEHEEMGRRHSGSMRYGNRLVRDEETQERVALAWRMKLEQNASLLEIHRATQLHRWPTSYTRIFDNLIYAGVFEFQDKRFPLDWEQGARFCEPYVTLEQFDQVQRNRELRRIEMVAPRSLSSSYLLSAMMQCGLCADKGQQVNLIGTRQIQSNYWYYRCAHKTPSHGGPCVLPQVTAWRLEEGVLQLLKETVLTPDFVRAEVERANALLTQQSGDTEKQLRDAKRLVLARRRDVEHIVELIRRKGMTTILESQYDAVNKDWNEAQRHVVQLEALLTHGAVEPALSLAEAYGMLDEMLTTVDSGLVEQQREVVKSFVDRIVVYPGRAEITLRFRLPAFASKGSIYQVNDVHTRQPTETLRDIARSSQRRQIRYCSPVSCHQKERLTPFLSLRCVHFGSYANYR